MREEETKPQTVTPTPVRVLLVLAYVFIGFWVVVGIIDFMTPHSYGHRPTLARVASHHRAYSTALETYFVDNKAYPPTEHLYAITTPVAYLNRLVADDFSIEQREGKFDWIIPDHFRKKKPKPLPMGYFSSGTQYLIYSRGPNQYFEIDPKRDLPLGEPALELLSYDPTNGTDTPGDLWRLGGTP